MISGTSCELPVHASACVTELCRVFLVIIFCVVFVFSSCLQLVSGSRCDLSNGENRLQDVLLIFLLESILVIAD